MAKYRDWHFRLFLLFVLPSLALIGIPPLLLLSHRSLEEKKAIKETVLVFLEERRCREAAKAAADGDGASSAASPSLAAESFAAGMAHANIEDRVDA